MFNWLFNWSWSRRSRGADGDGTLESPRFTVHQGKRYRATITLTGFESWASNTTIAGKLTEAGFKNVKVSGDGDQRIGEGLWAKPDTTAEIDPHLSNITEIA